MVTTGTEGENKPYTSALVREMERAPSIWLNTPSSPRATNKPQCSTRGASC